MEAFKQFYIMPVLKWYRHLTKKQKGGLSWIVGSIIGMITSQIIFSLTGWSLLFWTIECIKKLLP